MACQARDDAFLLNLAGGLGVGGTAGVGATVVVLVFDKTVEAQLGGVISSAGDVSVSAEAVDDVLLLALAFGGGGTVGVAGDVSALVFQNQTTAALSGKILKAHNVSVEAISTSKLYNIAATVAGGGAAAVAAVAIVTYFQSITTAYIADNSEIGSASMPISGSLVLHAS